MTEPIEVLITHPFTDDLLNQIRGISPRLHVTVEAARKAEEISEQVWERVEVLYTDTLLPPPAQAPNLKWIQFHRAGIDRVIHAPVLKEDHLLVTTLSGASATQVAEHVLTMLLALGHHFPKFFTLQQRGQWPADRQQKLSPTELRNSTVGIMGYGSIGRQVARLLNAFGATVLATKRDAMDPEDTGYHPEEIGDPGGDMVHRLYPPQALRSMLKEADFVVVAVPLTDETHHVVGLRELAAMKPTAFLVDISCGGVIDHDALVKALREGRIAGAALDVFPVEPLPKESPLWELSNVILTPHISGLTPHYQERAITLFAENIYRYMAELPLYNQVDFVRGY